MTEQQIEKDFYSNIHSATGTAVARVVHNIHYRHATTKIFCILFFLMGIALNSKAQDPVVNIPDAKFKAVLLAAATNHTAKDINGNYLTIDANHDGKIQVSEANQVTYLNCTYSGINSLVGITSFVNLKELWCYNNNLTILNLHGCVNLSFLLCSGNPLTSLDIGGCINLSELILQWTSLTTLDVSGCTNLTALRCPTNEKLTTLNVTGCVNLTELWCGTNQLTSLDVSTCTNLNRLRCEYSKLLTLDLSHCNKLNYLDCQHNQLQSVNLENCTELSYIDCSFNHLVSMDVSKCPNLLDLSCFFNELSSINFAGCNKLEYLQLGRNKLSSLNLAGLANLRSLECWDNLLKNLNLSACKNLGGIYCSGNQLTTINIKTGVSRYFDDDFVFGDNPNLQCIICNDSEVDAIKEMVTSNGQTAEVSSTGCGGASAGDTPGGPRNDDGTQTTTRRCLRSVVQTYDTRNVYVSGNQLTSAVYDGQNRKRQETENSYYGYQVKTRRGVKDSRRYDNYKYYETEIEKLPENVVGFTPLKYSKTTVYEYDNTEVASTVTNQSYSTYTTGYDIKDNQYGDIKTFRASNSGTLHADGSGTYDYETTVSYSNDNMTKRYYVTGMPTEVEVKGTNGTSVGTLRHIKGYYNDDNYPTHLTECTQLLNANDSAFTRMKYDYAGNIVKKVLPSKMTYNYSYDTRYNMYLTQVSDTLGYSSRMEDYNYKYGIPRKTTDINSNVMNTIVDNMGRVIKIKAPNETNYSILFEYNPSVSKSGSSITYPAYAVTKHFDPLHPLNFLETVTFVDGFGRAIQVKKDGVVNGVEKMIVSGRTKFDALGRPVESNYPVDEVDAAKKYVFNKVFSSDEVQADGKKIAASKTTYDDIDRVLTSTLPDGATTEMLYGISTVGTLKTTVIDALGNKQESFSKGAGQTVMTKQYLNQDTILSTQFAYDGINQLLKVTDTKGKITESVYDLGGRRTQVTHPASGITKFEYDEGGNLKSKQTANMIVAGEKIQYFYTFNRLDRIEYPQHAENNVRYVYGASNDITAFNRKGRLVYQEDGSGGQEFKYGKMGELTEVRRTMVIPNQALATYVTQWTYDIWSRVQTMTYPDGEKLTYGYNTAGLLTSINGEKNNASYSYVESIKYDKFEQRTYLKYGNGAETNYSYQPDNRQLHNLSVNVGTNKMMDNTYTYDAVSNVTKVENVGTVANGIGGGMVHNYGYDNLYRLKHADGQFTGMNGKLANYKLDMGYDQMHNIISKRQSVTQTDVQFAGTLNAGYKLSYTYANNQQQIANIADESFRYATGESQTPVQKTQHYGYDDNGNMLTVYSSNANKSGSSSRSMLWDEENRLLALSDNGFVSNYFYDAAGERTVKMSGGSEGVSVNGVLSGAQTGTTNFTAYISPYLVLNNGGYYSKHIYMGSQRIVSKLGSSDVFSTSPLTEAKANSEDFTQKQALQTAKIADRYNALGVVYRGTAQGTTGIETSVGSRIATPMKYFYHSDHLGSSSLITDGGGSLVQHIEYVPFGEVFVEERNSGWSAPYKFNGKEMDEETGLYYYGARYMDPRTSVWMSVDPLAEKHPEISSYVYCAGNPVNLIDPDGRDWFKDKDNSYQYNPALNKNNASKILTEGQSYAFRSNTLNDKNGTANYRKDGSIMFSNETDAYNRIWSNANGYTAKREFGKKGREEMGVIKSNGVLVLPDWNNNSGEVGGGVIEPGKTSPKMETGTYGYVFKDGAFTDPVTGKTQSYIATIHTHQDPTLSNFDLSTFAEGGDQSFAFYSTPNKPIVAMGANGNLYGAIYNSTGGGSINAYFNKNNFNLKSVLGGRRLSSFLLNFSVTK